MTVSDQRDADELTVRLGRSRPQVSVVPIGANIDVRPPDAGSVAEARQRVAAGNGPLLAFFGFVAPDKGLETLFEAMAQLKGQAQTCRLVIVGGRGYQTMDESYRAGLRNLAEKMGLADDIVWTGYVAADAAAAYLAAADLVVLPYAEGASMRRTTLMTALAYGLPVLSTATAGLPAILANGDGLATVPPGDAAALAAGISSLAADPDRRRRLAEGALEIARSVSWPVIGRQMSAVYERALGRAVQG